MPHPLQFVKTALQQHRQRHQPSGFSFVIADRIGHLDPTLWDAATQQASVFMRRDYLAVLQNHAPEDIEHRFVLIFKEDELQAAMLVQSIQLKTHASAVRTQGTWASQLPGKAKRLLIDKAGLRLVVCGNVLAWGQHGLAVVPGANPEALFPAVAEALYRVRRADRLQGQANVMMVKDLDDVGCAQAQALQAFRYRSLATEPDMVVTIDPAWKDFDTYLASMTKKYRKAMRKVQKACDDTACQVRIIDPDAQAERIHALYKMVRARAKVRLTCLSQDFLPALASALGTDFRCWGIEHPSHGLLGFVTSIRDGDRAIGYVMGMDYEQMEGLPIYHRLLQQVIADAIEWRCRSLSLGRTALDAKARLGAQPVPQHVYVRHRQALTSVAMQLLLGFIHHDEAPERHPFK